MKVRGIRTLAGPNVFHYEPVLVMTLDLGVHAETHSALLPGFTERLVTVLPGLAAHTCSRGYEGGFFERLLEGTYLGHITEHVAIELARRAGFGENFGKTVAAGAPGVYEVAVRFEAEEGTRRALLGAVELVRDLMDPLHPGVALLEQVATHVEEARRLAAAEALGPSTRALVEAARRRDLPVRRVGQGSLVQLGWGERLRWLQASLVHTTAAIGMELAGDKDLTKTLLRDADLPVPAGVVVASAEEARAALHVVPLPVAVKPLDGHHGQGVSLALDDPDEVERAFHLARAFSRHVVVEEFVAGRDYRALVVGGRLVAAAERVPAHVVGDGARTIAALVEAENEDPRRAHGHGGELTRIVLDEAALAFLRRRGLAPDSVPPAGEVTFVRETANLSTGGTARDVTDLVHADVRFLCERAARVVGLDVAGIDLVLPDITTPPGAGRIIEVNAGPGLRMHLHPSHGQPRDVATPIIDLLYPPGATGRIPIASITGTNGKTTTARMVAHALSTTGKTVGLTSTDGVFVGGRRVTEGDCSGPRSARSVLCDPAVQVAVLETARGGILRSGLGYDWSDVAVITNIQPDHLGQGAVETLDDLLHVKSLVAERVRRGGAVVLNAEDPALAGLMASERMRRVPDRAAVYFALDPDHPVVRAHRAAGGTAFVLRDGGLVEATGDREERLVAAADLPVTFGGTAAFQVQNALAALAAARALGMSGLDAAAALRTFDAARDNAGRANLLRVGGGAVLIDYGHNPDAFRAVADMVSRWPSRRTTCVVSAPGDRSDALLRESGRVIARSFQRVLIREDADHRGRRPGEVARLLSEAIAADAPRTECAVVLDERVAVERALGEMVDDELLVVFYDDLGVLTDLLAAWGAEPVRDVVAPATHQP